MEHVVLSHISKHVASNNILVDDQHRFRQNLSTTTQLISATHDWAHTLQRRGQTDVIFLDFQKAFDRVPHSHLQTKLKHYGIRGDTLYWTMSLLSNRQQAVVVNGSRSSWMPVTSGGGGGGGGTSRIGDWTSLVLAVHQRHNCKHPVQDASVCWR